MTRPPLRMEPEIVPTPGALAAEQRWRLVALVVGLSVFPGIWFARTHLGAVGPDAPVALQVLAFSLIFGPVFLGGFVASRLGRSPLPWALSCFVYGLPLLLLALLGSARHRHLGRCPVCRRAEVEAPVFGGAPLPGAPPVRFGQLLGFRRCRACGAFFEPVLSLPAFALVMAVTLALGGVPIGVWYETGQTELLAVGGVVLAGGAVALTRRLVRGQLVVGGSTTGP